MKKRYVNNLILLIIALIWGAAFVAQSAGMDYIGPFTFNSARSILGGIVLIPVIYVLDKKRKEEISQGKEVIQNKKTLIIGGICCGFFLMLGSSLQQIGIQYTTAGKAGFITALYILIVPILGLAVGKKAGSMEWCGTCSDRNVFSVYDIRIIHCKRRFLYFTGVCCFFIPYSCDRSFFTKGRRSEDVLYSVFCLWNLMYDTDNFI